MPKIWFSVTVNNMMRKSCPFQLSLNLWLCQVESIGLVPVCPNSNIYLYQSNACMWSENQVRLRARKQQITLLTANLALETTIGTLVTGIFGIYFHISKHYAFTAIYWFTIFRHYQSASFYGKKNFMFLHFLFSLRLPSSTSLCWVKPIANVYIILIISNVQSWVQ